MEWSRVEESEDVEILAGLTLGLLPTHLRQEALDLEAGRGLGAPVLLPAGAPLFGQVGRAGLEADLLQYTHQQLVHLMVKPTRGLYVLAVIGVRQA